MLETLISKIGISGLINLASSALGAVDNDVAKTASSALAKVGEQIDTGDISAELLAEINRHAEAMAAVQTKEIQSNLAETNQSLRAEIASDDKFVRRMRPTFGYIMAVTWAAQMMAIAYVMIVKTEQAGMLVNAMSSLSAIWGVGLSVLGIYVYKRSEEKKVSSAGKETIFWNEGK